MQQMQVHPRDSWQTNAQLCPELVPACRSIAVQVLFDIAIFLVAVLVVGWLTRKCINTAQQRSSNQSHASTVVIIGMTGTVSNRTSEL